MLNQMRFMTRKGDKPVFLHFEHAFESARDLVKKL